MNRVTLLNDQDVLHLARVLIGVLLELIRQYYWFIHLALPCIVECPTFLYSFYVKCKSCMFFQMELEFRLQNGDIIAAKCVVDELACLLKDAEAVVQTMNCSLAQMGERNVDSGTDSSGTSHDEVRSFFL